MMKKGIHSSLKTLAITSVDCFLCPFCQKAPSTVSKIFRYSDLPLPSSVDKISST